MTLIPERKEFKIHPSVLGHFIHSQAGSAGKAIIELIQNCIDAGATSCVIDIDRNGFCIKDNGAGFTSREEIDSFFATFGTPHSEGDATFGRFRVGRGQIMGFASTVWKSNKYSMTVDIKTIGYGFDFSVLEEQVVGCHIEGTWYSLLNEIDDDEYQTDELEELLAEIRGLVGYTSLTVILNGITISRDLNSEPWDIETDDAYIRVKPVGPLIIYNQGILVREDSGHHWGCGGVIVTKKAIKLNISRTEILRKDCEIWKRLEKEIKKLSIKMRRDQNGRLDENGRIRVAREMLAGKADMDARVVTILPRTHISIPEFNQKIFNKSVVIASHYEMRMGEKIANSGMAIVLHPDMFYRFNCTDTIGLEQAIKTAWIRNAGDNLYSAERFATRFEIISFRSVQNLFLDDSRILDLGEVDKETQLIYRALKSPVGHVVNKASNLNGNSFHPHIKIGRANNDLAWTDSTSYVAINERLLEDISKNGRSHILKLMNIMVHEACHAGDGDTREAAHDSTFYRRFHDSLIQMAPFIEYYISLAIRNYVNICKREKVKPRAWALR